MVDTKKRNQENKRPSSERGRKIGREKREEEKVEMKRQQIR